LQVCRFVGLQVCRFAGVQVCGFAGLRVCGFAGVQVCRFSAVEQGRSSVWVCRYGWLREERCIGVHIETECIAWIESVPPQRVLGEEHMEWE